MSMVVVSVAGVYYLYRDKQETAIPVSDGPAALLGTLPTNPNATPGPAVAKRGVQPTRRLDESPKPVAPRGPSATKSPKTQPPAKKPLELSGVKTARRGASDPIGGNPKAISSAARKTPPTTPTDTRTARGPSSAQSQTGQPPVPVAGRRTAVPKPSMARASRASTTPKPTIAVDFHRVQYGDTFSALSERYYGSASFSAFLIASNPQITDANRLRVGDSIKIPARPATIPGGKIARGDTARPSPAATPVSARRTYTVKPGDSFYKIAKERLGDSARWKELFELNQDRVGRDPSRLAIGQVLMLPKS